MGGHPLRTARGGVIISLATTSRLSHFKYRSDGSVDVGNADDRRLHTGAMDQPDPQPEGCVDEHVTHSLNKRAPE